MVTVYLIRYKGIILASMFFFYLGCGITMSFLRLECASADAVLVHDNELRSQSSVEYAVLILSSPGNEEKRDAIRATWAKLSSNIFVENGEKLYKWNHTWVGSLAQPQFIKFYYAVGTKGLSEMKLTKLINENHRSNDLLLLQNLEESYEKLATKLIEALKWLNTNLKDLKYVIKCDDDSFVRVDLIVRDLEAYAPEMTGTDLSKYVSFKDNLPSYKGLYWGYFDGRAHVWQKGKWQERDWFLCDSYLPYALGGGYVISHSIVNYLARNADFLSHYISEDVSMGVWTAALDGINRVHDIRFDTEWKSRGCKTQMLIRHKQTTSDMFQMYRSLVQSHGEKLCKTETSIRKSYLYMWDVSPSKCCSSTF